MARQIVCLALIFIALVGSVHADSTANAPTISSTPSDGPSSSSSIVSEALSPTAIPPVPGPATDVAGGPGGEIGPIDLGDGGDVLEAPLGAPVPEGAFGTTAGMGVEPPAAPKSGASSLEVSAVIGAAAVASFLYF